MKLKDLYLEIKSTGNIKLWHGSKHSFQKFDLNKIGTGQHSQDFGWGLYFTTKKETAEFYANEISNTKTPIEKYNENIIHDDPGLKGFLESNMISSAKRFIKMNLDKPGYQKLLISL